MSVKSTEKDDNLILVFDNGDKEKFKQILKNWNFKDEQSLLRFVMSAMLLTKDKALTITTEDGDKKIAPIDEFLK